AGSPITQKPISQSTHIHSRQVGVRLDAYLIALKRTTDLFLADNAKELDQQKTEVEKLRRDTIALTHVEESQRRELPGGFKFHVQRVNTGAVGHSYAR
ncbi:MAG: hypothetical protein WA045_00200, partial [Nitrospira sp.]